MIGPFSLKLEMIE